MGLSRQEYWSALPCPPSGDLPHPGMEPVSLTSPALAGRCFTASAAFQPGRGTSIYHNRLWALQAPPPHCLSSPRPASRPRPPKISSPPSLPAPPPHCLSPLRPAPSLAALPVGLHLLLGTPTQGLRPSPPSLPATPQCLSLPRLAPRCASCWPAPPVSSRPRPPEVPASPFSALTLGSAPSSCSRVAYDSKPFSPAKDSPVPAPSSPTDDVHVLKADAAHTPTLHGPGELGFQGLQHLHVGKVLFRLGMSGTPKLSPGAKVPTLDPTCRICQSEEDRNLSGRKASVAILGHSQKKKKSILTKPICQKSMNSRLNDSPVGQLCPSIENFSNSLRWMVRFWQPLKISARI